MAAYGLDYQQVPLHAVGWAPTTKLDGGGWLTTWNVRQREPLDPAAESTLPGLATSVSRPDFQVELRRVAERELTASIVTSGPGHDAAYWDPTYAMLRSIDDRVGRIWTIESKPRMWHPAFQFAQQALLSQLAAPQTAKLLGNCLLRATPLFAATCPGNQRDEEVGLFERATRLVAEHGRSGSTADEGERLFASLTALPDLKPGQGDDAMREIRREAVTAALAALRAVSSGARTMAALALRKAFDGAYLFDQRVAMRELDGIAFREDDLWFRDAHDLLAEGSQAIDEVLSERARQAAAANAALIESALGSPE